MPAVIKNSIKKLSLKFFIPYNVTNMSEEQIERKLIQLAAPKFLGGYLIDHISLHSSLFLLKPVMKYINCRVNDMPLTPELFFVEYHLGMKLCSLFGLKVNNSTLHTDDASEVYRFVFDIIRFHKISLDELVKGSVNLIYKRIILQFNEMPDDYVANYNAEKFYQIGGA